MSPHAAGSFGRRLVRFVRFQRCQWLAESSLRSIICRCHRRNVPGESNDDFILMAKERAILEKFTIKTSDTKLHHLSPSRNLAPVKRGIKRGLTGEKRTGILMLDELIVSETPPLYNCYGLKCHAIRNKTPSKGGDEIR